jgi:hypothetical protein
VQYALLSGFIQRADSLQCSSASNIHITAFDCQAGFLHIGAGTAAKDAIALSALQILFITFDLRLNVSQVKPPKLGKF